MHPQVKKPATRCWHMPGLKVIFLIWYDKKFLGAEVLLCSLFCRLCHKPCTRLLWMSYEPQNSWGMWLTKTIERPTHLDKHILSWACGQRALGFLKSLLWKYRYACGLCVCVCMRPHSFRYFIHCTLLIRWNALIYVNKAYF